MAEAAVTIFLEYMSQLKTYHADLISGAEDEVKKLVDDLYLVQAFLRDEAKKPEEGRRGIERKVKEAVYEVEDAIEDCLIKAAAAKTRKLLSRYWGTSLAKKVKSLREDEVKLLLDEVKNYKSNAKVPDAAPAVTTSLAQLRTKLPSTERTIKNDKVVCLKDEEEAITGRLMEEKEKLDVISIIGMAGLGKTTLARKIYESERIAFEFPIRIWVHVPRKFQATDVYLSILKWFTSEDMSILIEEEEKLRETVRVCLEEEKFLLVLDNVCSSEDWEAIKEVLPNSNGKGKVLITSRSNHVGVGDANGKSHKLRTLSRDERWELLQLEVFGNLEEWRRDFSQELVGVGENIVEKCGGLPLQILTVAGILKNQVTMNGWKKVFDYVHSEMSILDVMELTYSLLRDELRECFLYMGVFPQGCEISVSTLTCLWISEGFIQPTKGKSLEEIASQNLDDLISRSLVTADKINFNGEVKTCRVHDEIRAFCVTKSEEQNLYQEIKESKASGAQQIRRLCFRCDPSKFLLENPNGPCVRSLLCLGEEPVMLEPQNISVDGFPKLRILESKSIKLGKFPAKAPKLIHLRYLTLYIETLEILPEPLAQLWNLQALVVETTSRSIIMKANIWRMIRLRYLKTKAAILLDNKWEGEAGQNLHTLHRLAPESCTEAFSRRAKNLKTLGISGKLACVFENKFLEKLHHLEKLKLKNTSTTYEPASEDHMLHSLPSQNCFPPNLKRLTLTNTFLSWEHMSTLAMIKSLESLKLKNNAFIGVSWDVASNSFPNLQLLLIVQTNLVIWEASTDAFPRLRFLAVKKCENLKEIPECLGTHLEKLEVEHLRRSAVQSARTIGGRKTEKQQQGEFGAPFILKIGPV